MPLLSHVIRTRQRSRSTPAVGGSAIETAAAAMTSGQWLNFGSSSGTTGLSNFAGATGGPGASGVRTPYCSKGQCDYSSKKLYIHTGDHQENAYWFSYDWATNAWAIDHMPPWGDIGGAATARHGYDHNPTQKAGGKHWSRTIQNLNLRRWDGGTTWTDVAIPLFYNTSAAGIDYHEALNRIMVTQLESGINGALVGMNPTTQVWTTYASAGSGTLANIGDPHNFFIYNRNSQIGFFGGGNSSSKCWTIDSAGTIAAAQDIPAGLGTIGPSSGPVLAIPNPANGNFIVIKDATTWYDFDATARTFSVRGGTASAFTSNMLAFLDGSAFNLAGVNFFVLWELGVIVFVKAWARNTAGEMWLWKP